MDDIFEKLEEEIYRAGGGWCAFLVRALWPYTNGLSRHDTLKAVRADALGRANEIPPTFDDVLQSTFQQHNSGSDVFRRDASHDIFRFVGKKGEGRWAVNRKKALAWMALNGRASDFVIARNERQEAASRVTMP